MASNDITEGKAKFVPRGWELIHLMCTQAEKVSVVRGSLTVAARGWGTYRGEVEGESRQRRGMAGNR